MRSDVIASGLFCSGNKSSFLKLKGLMAEERNRSSSKNSILIKIKALCIRGAPFCLRWMMTTPTPPTPRLWFIKYKHVTTFGPSQKADRKRFSRWNLDADFHLNCNGVQLMKNGLKLVMSHDQRNIKGTFHTGESTYFSRNHPDARLSSTIRDPWTDRMQRLDAESALGTKKVANRNIFHFKYTVDLVCLWSSDWHVL